MRFTRSARNIGRIVVAVASLTAVARPAGAQRRSWADTASAGAINDSLRVIAQLKNHLFFDPGDSAAWHRIGVLAWHLGDRARAVKDPPAIDPTRMRRLADSALRIAADLSPRDVDYRIAIGQYLLASNTPMTRSSARGHFEKAVNIGRTSGNAALHALATMEAGRTYWWRYDVMANRYVFVGQVNAPRSVSDAMQPLANGAEAMASLLKEQMAIDMTATAGGYGGTATNFTTMTSGQIDAIVGSAGGALMGALESLPQESFKSVRQFLIENTTPLPSDAAGEGDFDRAFDYFHEAYITDAAYPGAFRALAMAYADRGMWGNLESMAASHVQRFPKDSLAWMALGLAKHRLQKDAEATAAFDSGVRLLGRAERAHLDAWERVLPTHRKARETDSLTAGTYWTLATPFWADNGHETHIEFLSRVTYSELRWTVEEFNLSGADTDRGDIYVRYGPPNKIIVIGPQPGISNDITTYWLYDSGFVFAFRGNPTFMTAHTPTNDNSLVDAIKRVQPVRWDNIDAPKTDTLPMQAVRFRAGRDSVDIVLAAGLVAPDSIKQSMSIVGDVQRYFWIVTPDLVRHIGSQGRVDTAGVYAWHARLAPKTLLYRVEEYAETANRGARSTGVLDASTTGFPLRGFGVSDVLIGVSDATSDAAVARWSDVRMRSTAGVVARKSNVTVVWENYDLTAKDGAATYDVALTLRKQTSQSGRIVARLAGAVAGIANLQSDNDQVEFKFSRTAVFADVITEHVTLALQDTPPGTYTLTLELTDRATGKTAKRVASLVVSD